jgi:phage tail sheath protein FI
MSDLIHGVEVLEIDDGVRPISTVRTSVLGLVGTMPDADPAKLPLNTPVLVIGQRAAAALANSAVENPDRGTLGQSFSAIFAVTSPVMIVVRVEDPGQGGVLAQTLVGDAAQRTGIYALLNAESVTGIKPRILIAPCADGFNVDGNGLIDGAPAAAALVAVAQRLRAVCVIDGPDVDAVNANHAVQVIGSKRAYLVDPFVEMGGVIQPNSPFVAALISATDNDPAKGFWWSPSNQVIPGISGLSRPIDYQAGDPACEADILNGFHVATIIRNSGYRLWGNRTCDTIDSKWKFLSVVRTNDIINDSIMAAHQWAVDRNITKTYVEDVTEGVNAFLRHLMAQGAILGGKAWIDPELNSPASIANGEVYFDYDFTPPYPAEKVIFRSHLVNSYISDIFE